MNIFNVLGFTRYRYSAPLQIKTRTYGVKSPAHYGPYKHAVDLIVPDPRLEQINVIAPSSGEIIYLKQDAVIWGPEKRFRFHTNFMTVQTTWGEFWEIGHLGVNTSKFRLGDCVREGDVVAKTGLNGWITETNGVPDAHTHFLVGIWTNNKEWGFKSLRIRRKNWETD